MSRPLRFRAIAAALTVCAASVCSVTPAAAVTQTSVSAEVGAVRPGASYRPILRPTALPTLSEQRAMLRLQISAAKQNYIDARPFVPLLPRADGLAVKNAGAAGDATLLKATNLVTAATTQALMDAAAKAVSTEKLRSATVLTSARQLKTLQDLRGVQRSMATKALAALTAGTSSSATYQSVKTRTTSFTTLLASDRKAQLQVIGQALPAKALQSPGWRTALETGSATIPSAAGWVGFPGGCALPAAAAAFTPKLPASGPGIATNSALISAANSRAAVDPTLKAIHEQMLRASSSQATQSLTLEQLRSGYAPRVARLGYGWLQTGNVSAGNALRSEAATIINSGPESMNTLTSSHLLLAASTAADWSSPRGLDETVLVRWIGPQTCLHADRENFVDAPTNIAVIHNSATLAAAAVFLERSPGQAAALARESLVSIQPALKEITTDGGTKEGPGYWTYQSRAVASLYATLPNVYATQPITMPSLAKVSHYAMNSVGPDGLPTPFADAEPDPLSPLMPAWDAFARKDQAAAAWVNRQLVEKPDAYLMWWRVAPAALPARQSSLYPYSGLAVLQLPAGTATLKGGDNAANHAHLDLGSISLNRRGVDWSIDPGGELGSPSGYYGDSTRWGYWKPGTSAHSTLMVGSSNQPIRAKAPVTMPTSSSASVNLLQAIPGATSATRSVTHSSTSMVVKDVVRANSGLPLTWQWVTDAAVTLDLTLKRAVLRKDGQLVTIRFEGVPTGAKLTSVPAGGTSSDGTALRVIRLSMPGVTSLNLTTTVW